MGLGLPPAPLESQQRWRIEEQLRIGAVDGPDALSQVGDIVPSADGRLLFVVQPQEYGIRVLDARTGTLMRTIGRQGGGPGEFSRVGSLSIRGDSLFAEDAYAQRIVVLSEEGDDLGTFKVFSDYFFETRSRPLFAAVTPSGDLWTTTAISPAAVARGRVTERPLAVIARDGELLHRVASVPIEGSGSVAELPGGGIVVFVQPLLSPGGLLGVASDGSAAVVVGLGEEPHAASRFTVTRIDHTGDTIFSLTYRFEPRPVTPALRDSLLDHFATTMFEGAGARARATAEKHILIPEVQRPVTRVLVAADGRTWLRREELRPRPRWLILNAAGELDGLLETPPGLELRHVAGDTVWGVVRDELDIPYVVRYRLVAQRDKR